MNLEDIPEMQLWILEPGCSSLDGKVFPFDFSSLHWYNSKFIEIQHVASAKYFVYANSKLFSHPYQFLAFIEGITGADTRDFRVRGGGEIFIDNKKVLIHGLSRDFEKYHQI